MRKLGWFLGIAGFLLADSGTGIRPPGSAAEYPAHQTASGVTVAAAMIAPSQVRKIFATDLNAGGYLVVEVGIYPEAGHSINLSRSDFLLRAGANSETVRGQNGRTIAGVLARKYEPPQPRSKDISVYPSAGVGYETGTDPVTGRRQSGVYTGAGVGVGIGDPGPPPPPPGINQDPYRIEQELEDKSLPEGKTANAVAGYLYFPKPSGKTKNSSYELTYYGADRQMKLELTQPKR